MYEGERVSVGVDNGVATLCFDAGAGAVNKFDAQTLAELEAAIDVLRAAEGLSGIVVSSALDDFFVGADINEFGAKFRLASAELRAWIVDANAVFNALEDIDVPTVAAVRGVALGGGLELALACDYRVAADNAQLGFPETGLGILPGFGGSVRAPRLMGADNAIEWIADGRSRGAATAHDAGMVDAVVANESLAEAAKDMLARALDGDFDWRARRAKKTGALRLNAVDGALSFEAAKGQVFGKTQGNYPAPIKAIEAMAAGAELARDEALEIEHDGFVALAQSPVADALVQLFINDQFIKRKVKAGSGQAAAVDRLAVIGAGIMGGGIGYQAASKQLPTLIKDVDESALDSAVSEAARLFAKAVERGKIGQADVPAGLARLRPTLSYSEFAGVDLAIEAVTEHPKVKTNVLAEVEAELTDGTVLASNTSSISIDALAESLENPEKFIGMHFFNPVHRMPLVEVIRGHATSDATVATVTTLARRLGKTPIVVSDCPGFLVNRVLFPYFFGFMALIDDGADFVSVDRVMEEFGWPMGPAYLSDVVGLDTSQHVESILAAGYPDRMQRERQTSMDALVGAERLGQKSGGGYYDYTTDKKGRPQKTPSAAAYELIADSRESEARTFDAAEIIDRLMIPMVIEAARVLEAGVADSPHEIDTALLMGLGFPAFRGGGALKYADQRGLGDICAAADRYSHLGPLYEPTAQMRELAARGDGFFAAATR
ncbi:fatty acid oxidation complex subunit alpha FadB [Salinisphaera sp. USBA-960]|uniref:fatty acid oxidation complex subunit alpha FadB n=1 Tax=Salinisphaera orenii TaxID=856731 RepID=UPI000DBE0B0B|nr:fatty acid oxidation complex subunit alpha FadB [Salifodinibacter halophilus]NNC25444.1 fatty acid oxidation complex subunit alpha FadB [Salifodinibacter halophilus]